MQVDGMWGSVVVGKFRVRAYKVVGLMAKVWKVDMMVFNTVVMDMLWMVDMNAFMVVSVDVHRVVTMEALSVVVVVARMVMMSMTRLWWMGNVMKLMMLRNGARMSMVIVKVVDLWFHLFLASCQIHRLTSQKFFDCRFQFFRIPWTCWKV